jgi:hypothetical protein
VAHLPPEPTTPALNFHTITAGVVDSGGKYTDVGGPQISSTNRNKFADLIFFYN